jgi:thioredoxin 1
MNIKTKENMKPATKKYLIIALLFVAVYAVVTIRNIREQNKLENLPDDSVIGKGTPVLLELGAHWCPPCRQMTPILNELAAEQKAFIVAFVDIDESKEIAAYYGVQTIPTQIFFDPDGNELFRHVGFYSKAEILNKWEQLGVGG